MVRPILAPLPLVSVATQDTEHICGTAPLLERPGAQSQPLSEVFTASIDNSIWSFDFNEGKAPRGVEFDGERFYVAGANAFGDLHTV